MKKTIIFLLMLSASVTYSQDWNTNFQLAKNEAINNNKTILLLFSGSDWCAPCIKLEKNIWQSAEFKKYAEDNCVITRADFPKKKQNQLPAELQSQNKKLAEKYNPEGVFPLVVLIDKTGKVLGKASYQNVSPSDYITMLNGFVK
jgi:thioredoxin-related protein